MSASESSSARPVAAGRLAHFEDGDGATSTAGTASLSPMSLPPRPRRRREPTSGGSAPEGPAISVPSGGEEGTGGAATSESDADPKGVKDRIHASNVHIPVHLIDRVSARCSEAGLSHGELIIMAIEKAHPRLDSLINPPAMAGGSLFDARRSRVSRSTSGPLTPLNYRLRVGDFEVIDRLVREFHARSRNQLITAALNDYFGLT